MGREPRVLFAIAHFDKGGGTAVQSYQLYQRLRQRVEARCLCLTSGGSAPTWNPETGIETLGRLAFPSGLLALRRGIHGRLEQYDVVQALDFYYSLPAARLAGAPRLAVRIGADPVEDLGSRYGAAGRWAMRLVNPWMYHGVRVVVNAPHFAGRFPGRPTTVIPNMVDLDRFPFPRPRAEARAALGLPAGAPLLCFTGKVIPRKNLEELFRLARVEPSYHILLVGELAEPYYGEGYFRRLLEMFPEVAPRLHAPGEVATGEIPRYLAAADVFVFPSRLEGMPNSVLEAMASGLPVVLSDRPAHRAVIAPGAGYLYGSFEELREHVARLLADPELSERTGRSARAHVSDRFGPDAAVRAYLELYRELAAS